MIGSQIYMWVLNVIHLHNKFRKHIHCIKAFKFEQFITSFIIVSKMAISLHKGTGFDGMAVGSAVWFTAIEALVCTVKE